MNWDKKATTAAVKNRHDLYEEDEDGYEFRGFSSQSDAQDHGFVEGAKWQRNQLRADEAVERVAAQMFTATQAAYEYWDRTDWDELHKSNQDVYRSDARAALTALLGNSDND